jgi:hypothetical protein
MPDLKSASLYFAVEGYIYCLLSLRKYLMMLSRTKVIKTVKELPENFSMEELFDKIAFLNKIESGRKQSKEGKVYSTAEAKKRLSKWLK